MSNNMKGMSAGLVATLVLSAVMQLKSAMGLWPEVNFIQLLISLGSITLVQAWMDHFIIGIVVWGLLYANIDTVYPNLAHWLKGIIVAIVGWTIMMIGFMPLAKAGFFGVKLGPAGALVALGYHLLYGLVLGATYGLLETILARRSQTPET
jgi:hypothetical protein